MSLDVGRLLIPSLAATMPTAASALPYLLGLSVLIVVGAVVIAVRIQDFVAALSRQEEQKARRSEVQMALRSAKRALRRAEIVILICVGLAVAVWLPVWTRRDAPELTELVFIVLGAGLLAPLYFAVKILSRVLETGAELLAGRTNSR